MPDVLDIREFFVEGGAPKENHVLLHISEPGTPEEKKMGYFFALSEIEHATRAHVEQLQHMIDDVERSYYQTPVDDPARKFEQVIESMNRRGHHLLSNDGTRIHCFLGILRGDNFSFVYHGSPDVSVFYQERGNYSPHQVIEETRVAVDKEHLFSSLLQGTIGTGDYVSITTPSVHEYFSSDRVQKLLMTRALTDVVTHIERSLAGLRTGISYGGIILHVIPREEAPKTGRQPKYLESAPPPPADVPPQNENTKNSHASRANNVGHIILVAILRAIVTGIRGIILGLSAFFRNVGHGIIIFFILTTNKGGQRSIVLSDLRQSISKKRQAIVNLSLPSKLLCLAALLMVVAFVGSAFYFRHEKRLAAIEAEYRFALDTIRSKKDAADAKSIYGDDTAALVLLNDAAEGLANLSENTRDRKKDKESLMSEIDQSIRRLQKWQTVQSEIIASVAEKKDAMMVAIDSAFLVYEPESSTLSLVRPDTKTVEQKNHESIPKLLAATTPKEQDRVVFLTGPQEIAEYDPETQTFAARDIAFPKKETVVNDIFVYSQRLFTLDPVTRQIYRHTRTQTGYDKGTAWIKSNPSADLNDAVSLAIDGDIYVLTKTGKILLFSAGEQKALPVLGLDPALESPEVVWTYNNIKNLYILESRHKRVVVLDKTGKLLAQYTDPAWQHPTGMIVVEDKKQVYVTDQGKIYRFSLKEI